MRSITTLVLLLLAAAAVAFLFFFERQRPSATQAEERTRRLLPWKTGEIDAIEIANAAGQTALKREASGAWHIVQPVRDRADVGAVTEVLKLGGEAEVITRIAAEEIRKKSELRDYGLDPASALKVTFHRDGEPSVAVSVGKPAAYEDSVYARIEDAGHRDANADDVVILRTKARQRLTQTAADFRDLRLFAAPVAKFRRVSVQTLQQEIALERQGEDKDAIWMATKPLATRADPDMADTLISSLGAAKLTAVTEATAATEPWKPAVGERAVRITVWADGSPPEGEAVELSPGADDATAIVRFSTRPITATLNADLLALRRTDLWDSLRDSHLAAIDAKAVTTIVLKDNARNLTAPLHQFNGHWYLAIGKELFEANGDRVKRLFKTLNEWEILRFIDPPIDPAKYGLDTPRYEIVLGSAKHAGRATPTPVTAENSVTLHIGELNTRFYAQWSHEKWVGQLEPFPLSEVPFEPVKWKSTMLLGFTELSIRQMNITADPAPPLALQFAPNGLKWSARRQGEDVTAFLDKARLDAVIRRLSVLSAVDWLADSAPALEALKQPVLRIDLVIEQFDEATGAPREVPVQVRFAPTVAGQRTALYYGQIGDSPQVFTIGRAVFEEIAQPLLSNNPEAPAPAATAQ